MGPEGDAIETLERGGGNSLVWMVIRFAFELIPGRVAR
jgi:hypothetical protein